jgi:hypothetical protein
MGAEKMQNAFRRSHKLTNSNGLGVTGNYTHIRPETQRQQIEAALRQLPESL